MHGIEALNLFTGLEFAGPVLDIGSGLGHHAAVMRERGMSVLTLDPVYPADIRSDWPAEVAPVGGIWCCHVLEHSPNPGFFLEACREALIPGGWLAVTVPPAKSGIVGGHVTLWNAGILLYHLILAGFDCSEAMVKSYGYNISVIVARKDAELPNLAMDSGDIERLARFFPFDARQGFDGNIQEINWNRGNK